MENIYETNDKFQFDKLNMLKPMSTSGGNYFIRFTIDGNFVYIQPPKCKTKQGIVKAGKKYYTDLMFSNANDQFVRWMENLETYCQQFIYKNREQWFEGDMEMHDIENYFTSPMKIFKSGTFYIVRTNVPSALGKTTLKIYDEHENEVTIESINENTNVMSIIEIQGIKCSAKSFQIEMEIKQLMVFKPVNLFEKCLITTPKISFGGEQNKGGIVIANDLIEDKSSSEVVIDESVRKLEEEEQDPIEHLETSAQESLDKEPEPIQEELLEPETVVTAKDDMEEIEFHLEQLPSDDTIQIKQRNEVYYEMYREARRKAKIAKDLALSSYLEAKRIKNTYMLNDVMDSDDSDLEEESEDAEFETK
jgi:hypothetical protein